MVTPRTGRPRGRPKGAKNKPKTMEAFVAMALSVPVTVPPRPIKAKRNWSPEAREAARQQMLINRRSIDLRNVGRKKGVPTTRTSAQHQAVLSEQSRALDAIITKLDAEGVMPDNPMAAESLRTAMLILRTQDDAKVRMAAARLLLDFSLARPTVKVEQTVRTAEDILDEMAEDEG